MESKAINRALQRYLLAVLRANDAIDRLALTEKARNGSLCEEASESPKPGQVGDGQIDPPALPFGAG